jgi:energy-coupling factor transporter ATP-binding protein EcfA2
MPLIQEIIDIRGGYTSYVDLRAELFDSSRNVERMARYRPVASHRQAFERLARSLNVKDGRCYLLTGSYGTGKSHLCLMLANYLQTPSGDAPMPEFFKHYAEADPAMASELQAKRSKGRYLVALCHWGGRGDFEEVVLQAVDEALQREGFGEDFDTHYLQAVRKIEEWEGFDQSGDPRGRFLREFEVALEARRPGITLASFKQTLRRFDFEALEEFKRLHQQVTTASFTYDKANLLAILTSTLSSEQFKERYQGLVVLFDEFGDTMERGRLSPKMFQQFAQLAGEPPVDCARLIFVGTAHKALTQYAKAYNAVDFRTASDRVTEVALTPDGVEDIISAIVSPMQNHPLWLEKVATRAAIFDGFLADCTRLKLFDWLKGPKIRKNIIENIYPMHPMATYALLQLARDVASNNRSVYTFFSGDLDGSSAPGSYGDFIVTTEVETGNKLNLYTADRLFDYFSAALSSDNRELRETLRDYVKDYESSRRELNRQAAEDMTVRLQLQEDTLVERILRLMLIYDLINTSDRPMPNRVENLIFGLYCATESEKMEVRNRLKQLTERGILYFDRDTGVYEFKRSKSIDLDRLVDEYKKEPKNQPVDLVVELNLLVPLSGKDDVYLEAKDYNLAYSEDKRLERRLVRPTDLDTDFFRRLEDELQRDSRKGDYEGLALYTVCQSEDDIQKARDGCAANQSNRIIVAIPKNPVLVLDAVLELRALQSIETSPEAQSFTTQDRALLNERLNGGDGRPGARDALRGLRHRLMSAREVNWFGRYASPLAVNENKPYDAANRVMEILYDGYRNVFSHDDFNKLHQKLDAKRNQALKEAVEKLLDYTQPLVIDPNFAQNRGDKRYLSNCLLNQGAMRAARVEGGKQRCELESDPEKYKDKLPSLAAMVREVNGLTASARLNLQNWLTTYRQAPYGQGPIALALSLAFVRRLFGDSLVVKAEESAIGELPLNSFDTIVNILSGQYPNAFFTYRRLRSEERVLVNRVFRLFGQVESAADTTRDSTIIEAYNALKNWWEALPPIARVARLYTTGGPTATSRCVAAFEKIAAFDPHAFLVDELPTAFGLEAGTALTSSGVDLIVSELPQVKQTLENALAQVEERIVAEVRRIFAIQQQAYSSITEAITRWYNALDANQRDTSAYWQTNDSKPLIVYLKAITDVRETFLRLIPGNADYNLKPVQDWASDRVTEYTTRLERGKVLIDNNRLKVESPDIIIDGDYEKTNGLYEFKDKVTITLRVKEPTDRIYIVEGNADPLDPASQRTEYNDAEPLSITENKTIRYAVQDADGNWSRVETVALVNAHRKHEIAPPKQLRFGKDQNVSFVFPQDDSSLAVAIRSFFRAAIQYGLVNRSKLETLVRQILDELPKE